MKVMCRNPLFYVVLYCAAQTLSINIESNPTANSESVIEVHLEKSVSLVCAVDGTQADEELVWLRNNAAVLLKEENKKGRSSVCVTPVLHEDNGATFTCYMVRNSTIRTSVTLNVTYCPNLSESEDVLVEQEAGLVLQCDILANPPVSNVSWTLNGSTVDLFGGGFSMTTDGSTTQLRVSSVERSLHEGTYQCAADCFNGEKRNKRFHVTVTEKTFKFPLMPMIAGLVVVGLTALLAVLSRWKKITKCCK